MNGQPPVLLCFAVREETRYFSLAGSVGSVHTSVTGMGQRNAERVVAAELARRRPALVLTCGFAGALRPSLEPGTVLHSERGGAGVSAILAQLGAQPGRFFCSPRIVVTAAEKRALFSRTGADAVEMESGVIERMCVDRGVPCATVRVISDGANEDLPLDFNALLTERMEIAYSKLAWTLVKSPASLPRLIRFHRQTKHAARRLGDTLVGLLRCQGALVG